MMELLESGRPLSRGQHNALVKTWDKLSDRCKLEAGYEEGLWI